MEEETGQILDFSPAKTNPRRAIVERIRKKQSLSAARRLEGKMVEPRQSLSNKKTSTTKYKPGKRLKKETRSSKSDDSSASSSTESEMSDTSSMSSDASSKPRKKSSKSDRRKHSSKTTRAARRSKSRRSEDTNTSNSDSSDTEDDRSRQQKMQYKRLEQKLNGIQNQISDLGINRYPRQDLEPTTARINPLPVFEDINPKIITLPDLYSDSPGPSKKEKKVKRASKVAYKRVDQLWDKSTHSYKLEASTKASGQNEWDKYIFTVRRTFDNEQRYRETFVDIKSKPLKECLQHVMANVKAVNLVGDTPQLDPKMLFLFLEDLRGYMERLQVTADSPKGKKAEGKTASTQAKHLRILIKYLDKDFAATKKSLCPLLESGLITYDLLWAVFKPNTIACSYTYGDEEQPRAFKIDYATEKCNMFKGSSYWIDGRYLEYDGKDFGTAVMSTEISPYKGNRKISSLTCFPLQYHKDPDSFKASLVERGKKFVALQGMNYKYYQGMAYSKVRQKIMKISINGRIMVDYATHRRINPNYQLNSMTLDDDLFGGRGRESEDSLESCDESDSDMQQGKLTPQNSEEVVTGQRRYKVIRDSNNNPIVIKVANPAQSEATGKDICHEDVKSTTDRLFSEEELLIASPVVLGFAFSEKAWLEFSISGISDVVFNEDAFDSLVLPENQKSIVKALVSSHTFHPSRHIDDIISGKGKGLVAVLHGPPGTGKTLTAEGIADLLKCPLYSVSAGDLGTDSRTLERELQRTLDVAHSWGAILLLDEADVFLEKRSVHDIHRNALVSIFLRLLEYFQGILFLTTNRVETFDEAFVSRIHLSLRYGELTAKAKKSVWKMFVTRVQNTEESKTDNISETDLLDLSRREVNGRQIKNIVRAAQALAVHQGKPLSMEHIRRVLDVAESFERDLKGGTGYTEAMRSYT